MVIQATTQLCSSLLWASRAITEREAQIPSIGLLNAWKFEDLRKADNLIINEKIAYSKPQLAHCALPDDASASASPSHRLLSGKASGGAGKSGKVIEYDSCGDDLSFIEDDSDSDY